MDPEKHLFDGKLEIDSNCRIGYVRQFSQLDKTKETTVSEYIGEEFIKLQNEITSIWIPILGLLNTGFGCYLYFSSISNLPVQTVAICGYLEPLSAVAFSFLFFRRNTPANPCIWCSADYRWSSIC